MLEQQVEFGGVFLLLQPAGRKIHPWKPFL